MMLPNLAPRKMLVYQSFGFLAIIALSWVNETIKLRHLILGNHPYICDYGESLFEMLMVLIVWFLVTGATRRAAARVRHLESFVRVCSWCRRVHLNGHWVDLEHFLTQGLHTTPSHGICEDCMARQRAELKARKRTKPRPRHAVF